MALAGKDEEAKAEGSDSRRTVISQSAYCVQALLGVGAVRGLIRQMDLRSGDLEV